MKKFSAPLAVLLIFIFALTGCGGNTKDTVEAGKSVDTIELNISAASSLMDSLTEIQTKYEKEYNVVLQFNFAASGALQKQIAEGAPCDLFISASKAHMDALDDLGIITANSRKDLLGNKLTLTASLEKSDIIKGLESLKSSEVESISIATPDSSPAGNYARQALVNLDVWDQIQSKLIMAKDVKQVLEYVETGNVDCGLVYKSDALLLETGVIICDIPEDSHDPIVYPAALIKASAQPEAANAFYDFIQTDYAKGVFEKHGFSVL